MPSSTELRDFSGVPAPDHQVDLEDLGLDEGGHLVLDHAMAGLKAGDRTQVTGSHPALRLHLRAWARAEGHRTEETDSELHVIRGVRTDLRWHDAVRAGDAAHPSAQADLRWGLAARGALVESGGPPLDVDWADRDLIWADVAPHLYAQAAANQWDPTAEALWDGGGYNAPEVEDAIVQIMTFLVENEQAALVIPARMISRMHPHYREVMQLLATQVSDEARHVEVFTRRALLNRDQMGISSASGRASLQTLIGENDFTMASFLLSVLGEGSFLDLLRFINTHAPDPVTQRVTALAARDEARHVAFGVAHTAHLAGVDPGYLRNLRQAVERRHDMLADTVGLNAEVIRSLVLLASGSWRPQDVKQGWGRVRGLLDTMDQGRRRRLAHIGFPDDEAAELSALHTQNFM